ncbi:hypothetical protein HK405_006063 [Cladochytrium tenue]|nr:hypothetical protein HK405_006063 [Cladochytrium tenue]
MASLRVRACVLAVTTAAAVAASSSAVAIAADYAGGYIDGKCADGSKVSQFDGEMDFLIIGDWGQQKDYTDMVGVAKVMDKWADWYDSKLVVSLGDNFYLGGNYTYDGVLSVNDTKFDTLWRDVYDGPALSQLPWWFILGSHDWYTNYSNTFEMEFAQEHKESWFQPNYFYTRRIKIDSHNMSFNFDLAGWNQSVHTAEKQLAWIDKALEDANGDDYVFLMGHHPTFTCASDVSSSVHMLDVLALIEKWQPTAYVNGLHHTAAYYFTNGGATLQLQIGNGGNADTACTPVDSSAVGFELANTYGFGHARITPKEFRIDLVTELGEVALSTMLMPRTPVVGASANTTYLVKDCDAAVAYKPTC